MYKNISKSEFPVTPICINQFGTDNPESKKFEENDKNYLCNCVLPYFPMNSRRK